jgi:hypothetical protein
MNLATNENNNIIVVQSEFQVKNEDREVTSLVEQVETVIPEISINPVEETELKQNVHVSESHQALVPISEPTVHKPNVIEEEKMEFTEVQNEEPNKTEPVVLGVLEKNENNVEIKVKSMQKETSAVQSTATPMFVPERAEEKVRQIESGQPVVSASSSRKSLIVISKHADDIQRLQNEWRARNSEETSQIQNDNLVPKEKNDSVLVSEKVEVQNPGLDSSIMEIEQPIQEESKVEQVERELPVVENKEIATVEPVQEKHISLKTAVESTQARAVVNSASPKRSSKKIREMIDSSQPQITQSQPLKTTQDGSFSEPKNPPSKKPNSKESTSSSSTQKTPKSGSQRSAGNSSKYFPDFFSNIKDDDEDIYGNRLPVGSSQPVASSSTTNSNIRREVSRYNNYSQSRNRDEDLDDEDNGENSFPNIVMYAQKVQEKVKSKLRSQHIGGKRPFHH